jgi:GNAT superfamily N-acetyltransferase
MDNTQARPLVVRRAAAADAAALTRLREVMLSEMGMLAAGADPAWRDKAEAWFARRLNDKDDFAAFVIEDPDLGVVSCAAGVCDQHAPGPGNPGGVQGLVFNMSTDARCRRRGYARACLDALLAWFRDETQARVINLNTTGDGIALYRSRGFAEPRYPVLQLRLTGPGARHLPAGGVRLPASGAHRRTAGGRRAVLAPGRCTQPSTRWPPTRSPAPRP